MLRIVLVTPNYTETGTPAGLCTGALALAFSQAGHEVHVVCSASAAPRLGHACCDSITVHRIATRRGSPAQAFSVQACQYILHLSQSDRCDVIECIDTPDCVIGLAALQQSGVLNAAVVPVVVDPETSSWPVSMGLGIAGSLVCMGPANHFPGAVQIPFPLQPNIWQPPSTVVGSLMVACDATTDERRKMVVEAFKCSDIGTLGWSLALLNADGRWSVLSGSRSNKLTRTTRQVVVSVDQCPPIGLVHAVARGDSCVISDEAPMWCEADTYLQPCLFRHRDIDSLSSVMQRTAVMSEAEYTGWSSALRKIFLARHDSSAVVHAHEQVWSTKRSVSNTHAFLGFWKELETPSVSAG